MRRDRERKREGGRGREVGAPIVLVAQGCHRTLCRGWGMEVRGQAGSTRPWEQNGWQALGQAEECSPEWRNLQPVGIKWNFLRGSPGVASSCLASLRSLSVLFGCPWVLGCGRWFRATGACPGWGRGHWQALRGPLLTPRHGCICLFLHRGRGCTNYARL